MEEEIKQVEEHYNAIKKFLEWKNYNAAYHMSYILIKEICNLLAQKKGLKVHFPKFLKEKFNIDPESIYENEIKILNRREVSKEDCIKIVEIAEKLYKNLKETI